jgi:hypothetical protein
MLKLFPGLDGPAQRDPQPPGTVAVPGNVEELRAIVTAKAMDTLRWYGAARRRKKTWARGIRLSAIVLFSIAGLVPVLHSTGLIPTAKAQLVLLPNGADAQQLSLAFDWTQLGYLAAALATAFLGLDKFFGLSSGWVRYITSELALEKMIAEFQVAWVAGLAAATSEADQRQLERHRLELLKGFSGSIAQLIESETQQWAAEFQGALSTLESTARHERQPERTGTIQLTLRRGTDTKAPVSLLMDDKPLQNTTGNLVTITDVLPGEHRLKAVAERIDGTTIQSNYVVSARPATVTPVELALD